MASSKNIENNVHPYHFNGTEGTAICTILLFIKHVYKTRFTISVELKKQLYASNSYL